jgi:hypothetical protein
MVGLHVVRRKQIRKFRKPRFHVGWKVRQEVLMSAQSLVRNLRSEDKLCLISPRLSMFSLTRTTISALELSLQF